MSYELKFMVLGRLPTSRLAWAFSDHNPTQPNPEPGEKPVSKPQIGEHYKVTADHLWMMCQDTILKVVEGDENHPWAGRNLVWVHELDLQEGDHEPFDYVSLSTWNEAIEKNMLMPCASPKPQASTTPEPSALDIPPSLTEAQRMSNFFSGKGRW